MLNKILEVSMKPKNLHDFMTILKIEKAYKGNYHYFRFRIWEKEKLIGELYSAFSQSQIEQTFLTHSITSTFLAELKSQL